MDLQKITMNCKPVRGKRLAEYLKRFLTAASESLSSWKGTFSEVMTAKVVEILRKRGVWEEPQMQTKTFQMLERAAAKCKPYSPVSGKEKTVNPS